MNAPELREAIVRRNVRDVVAEKIGMLIASGSLNGPLLCKQAAFRLMKAQEPHGGRIIDNGSISATTPRPNSAPYTATEHAIAGLTKSTALDVRPFDIACGQIDIGNAASDMTAAMSAGRRARGARADHGPGACRRGGQIDDGEFVILVGPSGCGTSMLLRMLAGLEPVTSG